MSAYGLPGEQAGILGRDPGLAALFVDAVAQLGRTDVTGVVVGDGAERAATAARARAAGLDAQALRLVGAHPDAGALLSAFDALVLSSRTEGLPMVLLEAMAAGVPIVAFGVGGVPDLLGPEQAYLAPPGDVVALGEALGVCLSDRPEAQRRAQSARQRVETHFASESWLGALDAVYRQVVQERGRGR